MWKKSAGSTFWIVILKAILLLLWIMHKEWREMRNFMRIKAKLSLWRRRKVELFRWIINLIWLLRFWFLLLFLSLVLSWWILAILWRKDSILLWRLVSISFWLDRLGPLVEVLIWIKGRRMERFHTARISKSTGGLLTRFLNIWLIYAGNSIVKNKKK